MFGITGGGSAILGCVLWLEESDFGLGSEEEAVVGWVRLEW